MIPVLDDDNLRAFVATDDASLVERLCSLQVDKRLLQLELIRRRLQAEAPELAEASGFTAHVSVLASLPTKATRQIAGYPSFGAYCHITSRLLSHDLHRRLPDGEVQALLSRVGLFVVSASMVAGVDSQATIPFDHLGRAPLPGTGLALEGPLNLAGMHAHARVTSSGLLQIEVDGARHEFNTLDCSPGTEFAAGELVLRALPRIAGIELNDADILLERNPGEQACDRLDREQRRGWMSVLEQGWNVLARVHPGYATAVGRNVVALVPLASETPNRSLSSSSQEAFGCIRMSFTPSPETQAEALVHEYHHNKLYALLDVECLVVPGIRGYSPWKDEPRPVVGLLHGLVAFQAVTEFWASVARGAEGDKRARAEDEIARRLAQVGAAITSIHETRGLTRAGRIVLEALEARLEQSRSIGVSPATTARARAEARAHRARALASQAKLLTELPDLELFKQRWLRAGGRLCPPGATPLRALSPATPEETTLCEALGAPEGVKVNTLEQWISREDRTLDTLGRLWVQDRPRFDELASVLSPACDDSSALRTLLSGHVAYVERRFADALEAYARLLGQLPDDIDLWRDLCFCLRHLRLWREAEIALHSQQLVVRVACTIQLNRVTLESLVADRTVAVPGLSEPSDAATTAILFLRFLASEKPS